MNSFVVFLRGINVGGKTVKMERLKDCLTKAGYRNVRTLLASGNVLLEKEESDASDLKSSLEDVLQKEFGFQIEAFIRTEKEIRDLIQSDPFSGITITPHTRLYVTFLNALPTSTLALPYTSPEKDFTILRVTKREVISVLTLSEKRGTVDAMEILEKEYGKQVTTRNWNTIQKIAALLA
jgi:uncharacterized protein (DUF1697 family)